MIRLFLTWGAISGGLAVALGAFASHGLRSRLTERSLEIFEAGARYQIYHALALLIIAVLLSQLPESNVWLNISGIAFMVGMLFFSGSLYLLAISGIKWLGASAPIGGAAFILGWSCMAIAALTSQFPLKS